MLAKPLKNLTISFVSSLFLFAAAHAEIENSEQERSEPANQQGNVCVTNEHFNDFDFWLGSWQVTDNSTGNFAGRNTITKDAGNCMIIESWTDATGSSGKSINYYNPNTHTWRQIWIGSSGYLIDIEGGLKNGEMVMEGIIQTFGTQKQYPFRGTWKNLGRGQVQQIFHQYDAVKKDWVLWFDGAYVKN